MDKIYSTYVQTVNRGKRLFTVSIDQKGKFHAHEIGGLTQWAKVTGKIQLHAHRLNPSKLHGNQYGRRRLQVGLSMVILAKKLIYDRAQTTVIYGSD
jgi:hypothetical protein